MKEWYFIWSVYSVWPQLYIGVYKYACRDDQHWPQMVLLSQLHHCCFAWPETTSTSTWCHYMLAPIKQLIPKWNQEGIIFLYFNRLTCAFDPLANISMLTFSMAGIFSLNQKAIVNLDMIKKIFHWLVFQFANKPFCPGYFLRLC